MNLLLLTVLIIVALFILTKYNKEGFLLLPPYWNASTRNTRRGSYDIRGDHPLGITSNVGPWNISSDYYQNYPYGRYGRNTYGMYGRNRSNAYRRRSRSWSPYRSRWSSGWW